MRSASPLHLDRSADRADIYGVKGPSKATSEGDGEAFAAVQPLGEPLLEAAALKRLQGVSFLGALSPGFREGATFGREGSRWDHSVGVAAIALDIARHLRLGADAERYAVGWGLLHDVATWPLSHTSEPAFARITGVTSRLLRRMIILGDRHLPGQLTIAPALKEMGLKPDRLLSIFEAASPDTLSHRLLWQVIRSPLTPDTLEGMRRTGHAFGVEVPAPEAIWRALGRTLFDVTFALGALPQLVDFWRSKAQIYSEHINEMATVRLESRWTYAIETAFRAMKLGQTLELGESDLLSRVRQFALPNVNFVLRYKAPLRYFVAESELPELEKGEATVTELGRALRKRPIVDDERCPMMMT